MAYLGMELGLSYGELLELPVTTYTLLMRAVGNVHRERNRLNEEALRNER